jgi:hypothetical protein
MLTIDDQRSRNRKVKLARDSEVSFGRAGSTIRGQSTGSVEYNYASGDSDSTDGHRGTFDQLYPTGHDKYGLADQVGRKNIRNARGGVDLKPTTKWQIRTRYEAW